MLRVCTRMLTSSRTFLFRFDFFTHLSFLFALLSSLSYCSLSGTDILLRLHTTYICMESRRSVDVWRRSMMTYAIYITHVARRLLSSQV
jgi:hypothetical protein